MTFIWKCLGSVHRKGDVTLLFPQNIKIPTSFPGIIAYMCIESCFFLSQKKKQKQKIKQQKNKKQKQKEGNLFTHRQRLWSPRRNLCYICPFQTHFTLSWALSHMNSRITSAYFRFRMAWVSRRLRMSKSSKMVKYNSIKKISFSICSTF